MSFTINPDSTAHWWRVKPNALIDPSKVAGMGVVSFARVTTGTTVEHDYTLHLFMDGASTDDKREFGYSSLKELNDVLAFVGVQWEDA